MGSRERPIAARPIAHGARYARSLTLVPGIYSRSIPSGRVSQDSSSARGDRPDGPGAREVESPGLRNTHPQADRALSESRIEAASSPDRSRANTARGAHEHRRLLEGRAPRGGSDRRRESAEVQEAPQAHRAPG